MPELPEVERAARRLRRAAAGERIEVLELLHPAMRKRLTPAAVASVVGRTISSVEQRAKHQLLVLDDGRALHAHFRMAGDWAIGTASHPVPQHARAVIELSNGARIALVDPRALSTLEILASGARPFEKLGLDPFDAAFDAAWLSSVLARRRTAIKPALLDQRVAAGLGNIYAAEALWTARIDPRASAGTLTVRRLAALVAAIRSVLQQARTKRGRHATGNGRPLNVYDREGDSCRRCRARIRRIVQAGRSTYYCPRCQAR